MDLGGLPHEVKEHSAANLSKQASLSESLLGSHLHLYVSLIAFLCSFVFALFLAALTHLSPSCVFGRYQIHSATLDSGVLENVQVLAELENLKMRLGWRIGFSCSGECFVCARLSLQGPS